MNQQPELNLTSFLLLIQSANTQKEKLEYIKQLVIYIKQTNKFKFQLDVDLGACVELWEQAGEGITKVQREIFGILNMIAEFGESMLDQKVITVLTREVKKLQQIGEIKTISSAIDQLLITYSFMNKNKAATNEALEICGIVFNSFFLNLSKILFNYQNIPKQLNQTQNNADIQLEKTILRGIMMINALNAISEQQNNRDYLADICNIAQSICTFFHIRCSSILKCKRRLTLPFTQSTNELRIQILNSLIEFIPNQNFHNFFTRNHTPINHLSSTIMMYTNQNVKSPINSILAIKSLNLLHLIINNVQQSYATSSIPGFIPSLIALSSIKTNQLNYKESQQDASQIRHQSIYALQKIQFSGGESLISPIIADWNYICCMLNAVGVCGGSQVQDSKTIEIASQFFINLLSIINDNNDNETSFHELRKMTDEQIEVESGIEEIDSQLFHSKQMVDSVHQNANDAKVNIFNTNKDETNENFD